MHLHRAARLNRFHRRLGHWLDHLAPRHCALCNQTLVPSTVPGLCMPCLRDLPGAQCLRCSACAMPLSASPCPCVQSGWPIPRTVVAADYAPPLDRLITAMKFGRELALARPLGELLAAAWLADPHPASIDCLVPIPLAPERLARRGFNQALEMARAFNRCLHDPLPVMANGLVRLRETAAQSELDLSMRRTNLVGSFAADARLRGARIGLVDDVLTSGSTLAEAARALQETGCTSLVAIVVARAA
jgi:ComF family protein